MAEPAERSGAQDLALIAAGANLEAKSKVREMNQQCTRPSPPLPSHSVLPTRLLPHAPPQCALLTVDLPLQCAANAQDGMTPLHYACKGGHEAIANALIDKGGANVAAVDEVRSGGGVDGWMVY